VQRSCTCGGLRSGFPLASVENTHPFVAGEGAFAHNGVIKPFQGMYELLTDEERARLEGETDSEQYFALLSASIADRGRVAGVRDAVHRIGRDLDVSSLNAMMLTPDELTVISSHDPAAGPREQRGRAGSPSIASTILSPSACPGQAYVPALVAAVADLAIGDLAPALLHPDLARLRITPRHR
jgi:hypothetical protein